MYDGNMTTTQTFFQVDETSDECFACQIDAARLAGYEISVQDMNHWAMWGCTCTTT